MLAVAGCTQTITQHELAVMQARAVPLADIGSAPSVYQPRGNELWYMGTEDGYDYYHYFDRSGTFPKEDNYRVPAAVPAREQFAFTTNHNHWRPIYAQAREAEVPLPTTSPTKFDSKDFHL